MGEHRKTAEEAAKLTKARIQESQKKYGRDQGQKTVSFSSIERLRMLAENERGDGRLVTKALKGKFCLDKQRSQMFYFNEHWHEDLLEQFFQAANQAAVGQYHEEIGVQRRISNDPNRSQEDTKAAIEKEGKLRKRIDSLNSATRMRNVINWACKGQDSLAITGDEWNQDPYALQTKNALINLRTGEARPGRPEDYINKACPIEWKGPDQEAPTWVEAFNEIFTTKETAHYFHKVLGASLIGKPLQEFFILWGEGANGKSTLLETAKKIMGPLSGAVSAEMIVGYRPKVGGADPELLDLQGKRLVWTSETKDGAKLNVETIKQFTGNDTLKGRYNYSNAIVEFRPQFSIFLLTNNKPVIHSVDYGTWRRVRLIPFAYRFVDEPSAEDEKAKISDLEDRIEEELPGILAWLVQGCLLYQQEGLKPPNEILVATQEYQTQEDMLQQFVEERCVPGGLVRAGAFREAYQKWVKDEHGQSTKVPGSAKLKAAMIAKGYKHSSEGRHSTFSGLSLREGGSL
ncbi:DNA primase family protein [Pseudodesulfovibrio sp.]|uniref:DNA primase family protein n=1 Tax=unclassified Pseudodesulfovibrio TaxID=2661612 RepID=UPI003B00A073